MLMNEMNMTWNDTVISGDIRWYDGSLLPICLRCIAVALGTLALRMLTLW
jgi:hypothetical protein